MKILLTSVGRRVELIEAFHSAGKKLNIALGIIGTDGQGSAPAMYFCDKAVVSPLIKSEEYIPFLLSLCKSEGVDCLIPTIDTDLLVLSENKALFEAIGTRVLVASPDKVKLCRDKSLTGDYFRSLGLSSPKAYTSVEDYDGDFPAFIKPKDGSSSINAYKVDNSDDLNLYAERIKDYVIQPYVSGREYTVDIFCDYDGSPVFITPRERLAVRAGEVLKTEICQDDGIIEEMKKLVRDFKPSGQITVQLIKDGATGVNNYIEINPRFGGGAPLSIKAGADSAEAVIRMLNGEKLQYVPYAARDKEVYSRFDQSICVRTGVSRD